MAAKRGVTVLMLQEGKEHNWGAATLHLSGSEISQLQRRFQGRRAKLNY